MQLALDNGTIQVYTSKTGNTKMSGSKNTHIDKKQDSRWHYDNCTIETEETLHGDWGTRAMCVEHLIEVTDQLPEPVEPDAYDNSQENLNAN